MAGEPLKKPWWVLTTNRRGSWWFAAFYTVLAVFEPLIAFSRSFWWGWVIGAFFVLTAVVAWLSLIWVLRHPPAAARRTSASRVEDGDDAGP